jgi:hypothetical protein
MAYVPIKEAPTYTLDDLTLVHLELVESVQAYEGDEGVAFIDLPRGRCQHPRTRRIFNERTFRPLVGLGLLDVGNGRDTPVRTTEAGRAWVRTRRNGA